MLTNRSLLWLHTLQNDFALKWDWVAVGQLQALIDHIAGEHGFLPDKLGETAAEHGIH